MEAKKILVICTTDSMVWNFLVPHIKELEKRGYYVECACSETGSFYNDLIEKCNIKMNKMPFKRTPYSIKNYIGYKKVCRLIKDKKFDTIFCHEPVGGAIGRFAGHKMKCKVIYMAHGFHFYKGASKTRKLYYFVERKLSKYTDILITINQEDYEASLSFNAKECLKINGVGIDTSKFIYNPNPSYLRKELNLSDESIIFLSVGELIKRKNHISFIKAIAHIDNPNIIYVIAGTGKLSSYLKRFIIKNRLEKRVFLLGYRTDINMLCNASDVFAIPSIHEGLSVALMEAMACGKPVIASNIRGNVDLINDRQGGFLVSTFDIEQYVESIKKLVYNTELRKKFGKFNKAKIQGFDLTQIKRDLLNVFE